jgi:hypothetical protein
MTATTSNEASKAQAEIKKRLAGEGEDGSDMMHGDKDRNVNFELL